jgi:hypothetical protein
LRSIDVIAAMGGVQKHQNGQITRPDALGVALIRVRDGNDASAYSRARGLLRGRAAEWARHNHFPAKIAKSLAGFILDRWLIDICQACGGRGVLVTSYEGADQTRRKPEACPACYQGKLVMRWTAFDGYGKIPPTKCETAHVEILAIIDRAIARATGNVKYQLERR